MSKSIQSLKGRLNNDFLRKLCYKVLIWNIFKAKLNAWNDFKKITYCKECGNLQENEWDYSWNNIN